MSNIVHFAIRERLTRNGFVPLQCYHAQETNTSPVFELHFCLNADLEYSAFKANGVLSMSCSYSKTLVTSIKQLNLWFYLLDGRRRSTIFRTKLF